MSDGVVNAPCPDLAKDIYKRVLDSGKQVRNKSLAWPVFRTDPQTGRLVVIAKEDVYNGIAGVSIYFAAMYQYFGDEEYRIAAEETIQPLVSLQLDNLRRATTIGAGTGIGGYIYTFTKLYEYTGNAKYLEEASSLVSKISDRELQKSDSLDTLNGLAGLTLSLLKHYEVSDNQPSIRLAGEYIDKILQSGVSLSDDRTAWETVDGAKLAGVAHGASGIAYTLLRYQELKGSERALEAGVEGLKFENELYDAKLQGWPDRRSNTPDSVIGWCNGSAGIGLSRLAAKEYLDEDWINRDIQRAYKSIKVKNTSEIYDNLCHGKAGIIDFLISGINKEDYDWESELSQIFNEWNPDSGSPSDYYLPNSNIRGIRKPTLFLGLSGIGYTILRCLAPDEIDSVLLWK